MQKYTKSFPCAVCGDTVEEYAEDNKSRTIKRWISICSRCFKKVEKQIDEQERRIGKLEKKVFKK